VDWFKRHLNLTWLFGALFVLILGSLLINFAGLDILEKGSNQAYFFIWCMLPLNGWILWQKGRSLHWLWLAFFFVPYISLVLGNKKQSSPKDKTLPSSADKKDKTNRHKQKQQKLTSTALKFNKAFYILGIVFSALFVLGILASIPVLITKDYQKEDYVFYILDPSPEEAVANDIFDPSSDANFSALLYGHASEYFSGVGYSCIELNNDT